MNNRTKKSSRTSRFIVRVCGEANQGGRKDMEDFTSVVFDREHDGLAFFGVFDGHGGKQAAMFARERLWDTIKSQKGFYSSDSAHVIKAIKEGFMATHRAMWKQLDTWPKTRHGLPSTSGTTVSVVIVIGKKLYIAHVGDSSIALGTKSSQHSDKIEAVALTHDHKPEEPSEKDRIEASGGKVLQRNGISRVAWKRPVCYNHKGPMRRSTKTESVPFLAVSRSLGDLWSFDYFRGEFVVSPIPDVRVHTLVPGKDQFVILATDGLWGVVRVDEAVRFVDDHEKNIDEYLGGDVSHRLISRALSKWRARELRADNTSVIVVFFEEMPADSQGLDLTQLTPESENESEADLTDTASSDSSVRRKNSINSVSSHSAGKPQLVRKLAFRCPHALSSKKSFISSMLSETKFPSRNERTNGEKNVPTLEISKSCLPNGLKHSPL